MRFNGRATTDAQALTALVAADGTTGGFIKDSQAGNLPATATNDSATAGNLGEYLEGDLVVGSATSLVSNTAKTVCSVALTAGDWDVWFHCFFRFPATTSTTRLISNVSSINNSLDAVVGAFTDDNYSAGYVPVGDVFRLAGPRRVSLSAGATYYGVAFATFTLSTLTAYGKIRARRVR